MKFDVMNRYSGEVQLTAEIDCEETREISWRLRQAAIWAIKNCADLRGVDLSGAGLRGADLRCVNLSGADLRCVNLSGADLRGVNLSDTNLCCANLSGADLRGADLSDTNLHGVNLRDADLSDTNLRDVNLSDADLRDVNLSGVIGYILGPQRPDGYRFDVRVVDNRWCVVAGCRTQNNWTTDEYRTHTESYEDERKRAETIAILDYLDARIAMEEYQ